MWNGCRFYSISGRKHFFLASRFITNGVAKEKGRLSSYMSSGRSSCFYMIFLQYQRHCVLRKLTESPINLNIDLTLIYYQNHIQIIFRQVLLVPNVPNREIYFYYKKNLQTIFLPAIITFNLTRRSFKTTQLQYKLG